jgi:nodulation protein E
MSGIVALRRVAVTGMGVISAIGCGLPAYRAGLRACSIGIAPTRRMVSGSADRSERTWNMAAVTDEPEDAVSDGLGLDPFARFAVRAAEEALSDAGVRDQPGFKHRTGIVLGTVSGGDQAREEAWTRTSRGARPHPLTVIRTMANSATSAIAIKLGITGPALTISTACASSAHALGEAFRMVRFGLVDYAIAGGSEGLPGYTQICAWNQTRAVSEDPCRPFAATRKGLSLGEGAGVLVLEPLEQAEARGAKIYAELAGFAMGSDAADWHNPDPAGMLRTMTEALADAGSAVEDLVYISAHATGTVRGDAAEAEALQMLLGQHTVPVSSTKGLHGHAIGASGALEAIASILALHEGWLPGMQTAPPDPAFGLNLVWQSGLEPATMTVSPGSTALSNSFGFGGLNAVLVFRNCNRQVRNN